MDQSSFSSHSHQQDSDLSSSPPQNEISNQVNDETNQKNMLIDINFSFAQLEKTFTQIEKIKDELQEKYDDVDMFLDDIQCNLNKLTYNKKIIIDEEINNLDDLLYIAKKYGSPSGKNLNYDSHILYNLIGPLTKLKHVIGLDNIKTQIVEQILTSIQNMYDPDVMFHTVIKGPPGTGKTMLAKIIGEIYLAIGILHSSRPIFKIATRSDLIGKYLGHTAIKTQDFINSCSGGIMFIDEVYSLGTSEKHDSYSKECIDTINMNLTEKKNFICIIAGYSDEIEKCFFSYNPGLHRRFPFVYEITDYTGLELTNMLLQKIIMSDWSYCDDLFILSKFIEKNKKIFVNFGGDIENLLLNAKIAHSKRVFGKDADLKKKLMLEDIEHGLNKLIQIKKDKENEFNNMYI